MRFSPRFLLAVLMLAAIAGCSGAKSPPPGSSEKRSPAIDAPAPVSPPASDEVRPLVGFRAPSFVARDVVTKEPISLSALRGQVVMLNFWATWCAPCRIEMPAMEQLHKETAGKVRIIALGADSMEPPDKLLKFGQELGLTFTLAHDGGEAAEKYRVIGIPTTLFIDKEGIVRVKHQGQMTVEQMRQAIAETERQSQ